MTQIGPPATRTHVRIAAWLLLALLALAIAEMAARIVFPLPEIRNFDRGRYSPQMVSGPLLAQATLAHASFIVESAPDNIASVHKLNLYGFRDRDWRIAKGAAKRVLVLGDSMVEGFLASEEETIPRVLERLARSANEDVEVLNLGVGGAGLNHYIALVQDAAQILKPDEIVLVLHANDLLGSPTFTSDLVKTHTEATARSRWMPRIASTIARVVRHQAVPRRWHQEPFSFFPSVPNPANPWTSNGEAYSKFVTPALAKAMREGRFNPFNTGEVQAYEHYLRQPVDIKPWLEFLKKFLGPRNIKFSVVYIPQPSQTTDHYMPFKQAYCPPGVPSLMGEPYQQGATLVASQARELGIPFLNLTAPIRDRESAGSHLYWDYDEHMRPSGYAFVAAAIQELRVGQPQDNKQKPSSQ
ncbi:MAG TPA: SGNH/GDSL hydrolase family protein [Burkholderiaceae bacterium]|nr:SGNH/GDSL hydrolase family protein [Burkholderiaceae bacterium]